MCFVFLFGRYYKIDCDSSLLDNLKGKVIIEYPTLLVIKGDRIDDYQLVERESDKKKEVVSSEEEEDEEEKDDVKEEEKVISEVRLIRDDDDDDEEEEGEIRDDEESVEEIINNCAVKIFNNDDDVCKLEGEDMVVDTGMDEEGEGGSDGGRNCEGRNKSDVVNPQSEAGGIRRDDDEVGELCDDDANKVEEICDGDNKVGAVDSEVVTSEVEQKQSNEGSNEEVCCTDT